MQEQPFLGEKKQLISVKEARKLLGSSYDSMPDKMVELVISDMTMLSGSLIDWQNGSTKSEGVL